MTTPYIPIELPLEDIDYRRLFGLVGKANAALALYDGLLRSIPNPGVMLAPLVTQEAVLSSRIEGTQATVDEVLEHEAGVNYEGEKTRDIQEVLNYRSALTQASRELEVYPIRLSTVRQIHKVLLDSVRGSEKSPGEFRVSQNWIGAHGSTIEEATYVPPNPSVMRDSLEDWEVYLSSDDTDFLVQAAIMHAQFELIHPFADGNGRIGRILIPLFLANKKVLSSPMFYLSEYLETHRGAYYAALQNISSSGDWDAWIEFFLGAVVAQANRNSKRVAAIRDLHTETQIRVAELTRSQWSAQLVDAIFTRPIFSRSDVGDHMESEYGVNKKTTRTHLNKLCEAGILSETREGSGSRSAVLCFEKLLAATEGREV